MFDFQSNWILFFFILLVFGLFVQLVYYTVVFSRLAFYKSKQVVQEELPPVSIIIAARNEYKNLEKNLKFILEQDYPNFEVVVVNDCSWDDSQNLLEYFQEQYPNLKVCELVEQEKYPTGKKFALTIGIKAAQYNQLFFTDADCVPAGRNWLRLMQEAFTPGKEIVLGYSPYRKKNSLLNIFIRFESIMTATFYLSAALGKHAFMGVGRNLAYSRDLFFRHKGFAKHQHILSGDDDLFVNETSNSTNVAIQLDPESFVWTEPKKNYEEWSRQKSRHISTGKFYRLKDQFFLGGYYFSQLLFYVTLMMLVILGFNWQILLGNYLLRWIVQTGISYPIFKKLKAMQLIWVLPVLDLLFLFYIYLFGLTGLFTRQRKIW